MIRTLEHQFAGRTLSMEVGRLARLAQGSCVVQYGETVVLCAATVQGKPTHLPFFPLTIEYRERTYAAGKIPGGFFKREGRPSEKEILSARQVDRPIRPLFPDGFMHETQVACFVLSADQENDADILALLGASVSLNMSKVPFDTPVAAVRVGRVDGEWVVNPTFAQLESSDIELVVAGSADAVTMVEGGAQEVPEADVLDAIRLAHDGIKELCALQEELIDGLRSAHMEWSPIGPPADFRDKVAEMAGPGVEEALSISDKNERMAAIREVAENVRASLDDDDAEFADEVGTVLRAVEKKVMRRRVLDEGKRADGRGLDEIRELASEVGVLPRTHGSGLFTRGQTQALVVATLGTGRDEQRIDSIDTMGEVTKSFMLHYNFPPFSVGEARPYRGTSRREIGHGNLAERAISPLLPGKDDFPYTIRVVSDILESNGSSSMATVCGSSLALMDAGVPINASCAGIAMGLVKEGERFAVLTDILGLEDALGDMDFKVAGTRKGVTAIQMDIKIDGLDMDLLQEALTRAHESRLKILDHMDGVIAAPREDLSAHAPQIIAIQINPEKIGDLIGPKGKIIRSIQEESGAKIEVDDEGLVKVAATTPESGARAREMIEAIVAEPEVGIVYEGIVKNTTTFGAFVEIMPGIEGLCHISELQEGRTNRTEDVLKRGDKTRVKLLSVEGNGKLRLSRRAAISEEAGR